MSEKNWVWVGEPDDDRSSCVALWLPCPGAETLPGRSFWRCGVAYTHGHIAHDTEDGTGIVPVPIVSLPFFEAVIAFLRGERRGISEEEKDAFLGLREARELEPELTDDERDILDTEGALKEATRYGYWGP